MLPSCIVNNDAYKGGKEKDASCNEEPPGLRIAGVILRYVIEGASGQDGENRAYGEGEDGAEEGDGADDYFYHPFGGLFHNKTS